MKPTISVFLPYTEPPKSSGQHKGERVVKRKFVERGQSPYFVQHYLTERQENDQKLMKWLFLSSRPKAPLSGPLRVSIQIYFPPRKEDEKELNASGFSRWNDVSPDIDNIVKLTYLDALTQLQYWQDDSQIASLLLEKHWHRRPGIRLRIWCLSKYNETDLPPVPAGAVTQATLL